MLRVEGQLSGHDAEQGVSVARLLIVATVNADLQHGDEVHQMESRLVDSFDLELVLVPFFLGSVFIDVGDSVDGRRVAPVTEVLVLLG